MKRIVIFIGIAIASVFLIGAERVGSAACNNIAITSTSQVVYFDTRGRAFSISFEPDHAGAEALATVAIETCTRENSTSCADYTWDDGVGGITNILTGASGATRGISNVEPGGFIRVTVPVQPTVGLAEINVCTRG